MEESPTEDDARSLTRFRARLDSFKYISPARGRSKTFCTPRKVGMLDNCDEETPSTSQTERELCSTDEENNELPVLGTQSRRSRVTVSDDTPLRTRKPRKRPKRGYAPPEVYEHLDMLQDHLGRYLDVMFCGINPGYTSAESGHHYAHATNHFWECLHLSKLTDRLIPPEEDHTLPVIYNFGLTNLVSRPSAEQSELSAGDMREGVPSLIAKITMHRPRIVCILARSVWEVFIKEVYLLAKPRTRLVEDMKLSSDAAEPVPDLSSTSMTSRFFPKMKLDGLQSPDNLAQSCTSRKRQRSTVPKYEFAWGLQPFKIFHTQLRDMESPAVQETVFFVVPSPSARVVHYQRWDKVRYFEALRKCIGEVKLSKVDTSIMHTIPLTITQSIYFPSPPD